MASDLITPENVSKEVLKSAFEAAFLDVSYDADGDLKVKDQVTCLVFLNEQKRDRIALMCQFAFKSSATPLQRLECANNINREYVVVRAVVGKNGALRFEYDILLFDGITRKSLVLSLKRFCAIPRPAILEFGPDLVE